MMIAPVTQLRALGHIFDCDVDFPVFYNLSMRAAKSCFLTFSSSQNAQDIPPNAALHPTKKGSLV